MPGEPLDEVFLLWLPLQATSTRLARYGCLQIWSLKMGFRFPLALLTKQLGTLKFRLVIVIGPLHDVVLP